MSYLTSIKNKPGNKKSTAKNNGNIGKVAEKKPISKYITKYNIDDYTGEGDVLEAKDGIQIAKKGFKLNPKHKGWCTPITKSTCTGKRKTFALNAKRHFKKKADGGNIVNNPNRVEAYNDSLQANENSLYNWELAKQTADSMVDIGNGNSAVFNHNENNLKYKPIPGNLKPDSIRNTTSPTTRKASKVFPIYKKPQPVTYNPNYQPVEQIDGNRQQPLFNTNGSVEDYHQIPQSNFAPIKETNTPFNINLHSWKGENHGESNINFDSQKELDAYIKDNKLIRRDARNFVMPGEQFGKRSKYGSKISKKKAESGITTPNNPEWQLPQTGISNQDIAQGMNATPIDPLVTQQLQKPQSNLPGVTPQDINPNGQQQVQLSPNSNTQSIGKKGNNKLGRYIGKTFDGAKSTDLMASLIQGIDGLIPQAPIQNNKKTLIDAYNPYPLGTGSHASFKNGGSLSRDLAKNGKKLSKEKAREILHDGTANDHKITEKQRKYFGAVASGYAANGKMIPMGNDGLEVENSNIGYMQGMEYDLPEEEVKRLQKLGYQLEY